MSQCSSKQQKRMATVHRFVCCCLDLTIDSCSLCFSVDVDRRPVLSVEQRQRFGRRGDAAAAARRHPASGRHAAAASTTSSGNGTSSDSSNSCGRDSRDAHARNCGRLSSAGRRSGAGGVQ